MITDWKLELEELDPEDPHDAEIINEGIRIESIPIKSISAQTKANLGREMTEFGLMI